MVIKRADDDQLFFNPLNMAIYSVYFHVFPGTIFLGQSVRNVEFIIDAQESGLY